MQWKPTNEELEIAREELEALPADAFWSTPDQHAQYRRDGETNRLVLMRRLDHPMVEEACERVKTVASMIDWEVDDSDVELLPAWHPDPEEVVLQERMRLQEQLVKATCANTECDVYLAAMDLEEAQWQHLDDAAYEDEDGVEQVMEIWSPVVTCYKCETDIQLAPDHYAILAGDDIANRFKSQSGITYRVLTRPEVIEMIDGKDHNLTVLGTFCPMSGEVLPPFYRGLMVSMSGEEEE